MDRLKTQFFEALQDDFAEHGATAIQDARLSDPAAYLGLIARCLPTLVETTVHGEASWAQLLGRFSEQYTRTSDTGEPEDQGGS